MVRLVETVTGRTRDFPDRLAAMLVADPDTNWIHEPAESDDPLYDADTSDIVEDTTETPAPRGG